MLERMREFSKGWIMKILLGLVALSFVAYFGAAPGANKRQERQVTAVWVNGESVTTQEYWRIYNSLREEQERAQGYALDERQQNTIARRALEEAINHELTEQWFKEMGLEVTDKEVGEYVRSLWQRIAPNQPLTQGSYERLVRSLGVRSAKQFEDAVRRQLALEKVSFVFASMAKMSEPELQQEFVERQQQAKVKVVSFKPSDYVDQVKLDQDQLTEYYEENAEFYRQPERVEVEYIRIRPSELADEVVIVEDLLKDFYNRNRDNYRTEPKASADYVQFAPEDYMDAVTVTDEEVEKYFEEHPNDFFTDEKVKVRYIPIATQDMEGENAPSERRLQVSYADYKHLYQEVEVSMIRLDAPPGASTAEQNRILNRMQEIRQEILEGKDFADAAKAYSDHESSEQGGRLGFKMRGQLPREHESVVFRLGVGDISKPIQDDEGYVIFKVHTIHEPPLEEIQSEIAQHYAKERLDVILQDLKGRPIPDQNVWKGLRVYETDFFKMGEPIDSRIGSDNYVFARVASRLREGQTSQPVYGMNHLFLMTRIATEESRRKTLEEARDQIVEILRERKAPQVAQEKAEEAKRLIDEEGLTFEEMAGRMDKDIANSGYFTTKDSLPSISENPYSFMVTAFQLEPNAISEILQLDTGYFILRGQPMLQATIPVFQNVREEVEADFRKMQSVRMARDRTYEYLAKMQEQDMGLKVLASLENLEVRESGAFAMDDSVPGVVDPNKQFRRAAFSIDQVGDVWPDVVELGRATAARQQQQQQQQQVDAFYLLQLKDQAPTHIPPLSAIADEVAEDLKNNKAAELARQDAEEFVAAIKPYAAQIESGEEVDLEQLAINQELESAETPYFSRMGYIPGIPGAADDPSFSRTAFGLEPGQMSGIVEMQQEEEVESPEGEMLSRVHPNGFFVMQLVEIKNVDMENFEDRRQSLEDQMIYRRRVLGYQGWLDEQRKRAEIVENESVLESYGLGSLVDQAEEPGAEEKKEQEQAS